MLVLALNELLRGTRWAHLTARAGEAPATVMGARRDSQDRTGVLRAVAHRTQRDTAREWGSSNAASRGVATKVVAAVSHGEMTSLLFSCRAELGELHALAREAAVSYSLHYSETEDAWYVTVDSAAPAECYVTKTRTLPIALGMALEHLRKLVSRG